MCQIVDLAEAGRLSISLWFGCEHSRTRRKGAYDIAKLWKQKVRTSEREISVRDVTMLRTRVSKPLGTKDEVSAEIG